MGNCFSSETRKDEENKGRWAPVLASIRESTLSDEDVDSTNIERNQRRSLFNKPQPIKKENN